VAYLKVRKRLARMPMFPDTQDGTTIHLNGERRPVVARLLRVGKTDRLVVVLRDGFTETFAPFAGYEIGDDVREVRQLMRLMSTHFEIHEAA
jgi:hypothetical protein